MASPQIEDGFTRIANDVLEALSRLRVPGEPMQLLLYVLRKTWGFQKKSDAIPLSQFCLGTGMSKQHVCMGLRKLLDMNLIITEKGNGMSTEYRFNKDFDTWKSLPKKVTLPKKVKVVTEKGKESLPYSGHSKETNQKKDHVPRSSEHRPDPRISEILKFYGEEYKRVLGVSPNISWGKDSNLAKKLIAVLESDHPGESVSRAKGFITKFLTTSDDFTRKTGKDFGVFFSQLNKLRTGSVSGVVDNSKIDFPRVSGYVTL